MKCLKFNQANTNLFPQIRGGHPVFDAETGLIPACKDEKGVTSILIQLEPEELKIIEKTKGRFFLTFSQQHNIASIQDHIGYASFLADFLLETEIPSDSTESSH